MIHAISCSKFSQFRTEAEQKQNSVSQSLVANNNFGQQYSSSVLSVVQLATGSTGGSIPHQVVVSVLAVRGQVITLVRFHN